MLNGVKTLREQQKNGGVKRRAATQFTVDTHSISATVPARRIDRQASRS